MEIHFETINLFVISQQIFNEHLLMLDTELGNLGYSNEEVRIIFHETFEKKEEYIEKIVAYNVNISYSRGT